MKKINVYEYSDLSKDIQKKVFNEFIEYQVEGDIDALEAELNGGVITKDEFYKSIGCSEHYAETTGWFVSSCYYEHNKKSVDSDVKNTLGDALFTKEGKFIQYK